MPITEDFEIFDSTPASTLEAGDPVVLDNELCIVLSVDDDREDIDEVLVKVDNLSGGENEFPLFADDEISLWRYV